MPDKIPFSEFTFGGSTYVLKDAVARAAIDQLNSFEYVVCTSAEDTPINITWGNVTGALLPDVDTTHKIYLVLSTNGTNDNYDEYLTIQNGNEFSWEKIGNTDVDLTGYVVKDNAVVTSSLSMGRLAGSTVGVGSTALGQDLIASGRASYAEGIGKTGTHSIIVNGSTKPDVTYGAIGTAAHAEGNQTTAYGADSHAEGYYSIASGSDSHAEGNATKAYAKASHAEGTNSTANGEHSHAEGYSTVANGNYSHTEGYKSNASGTASHAEGNQTVATGLYSHTEGSLSKADGPSAHAEGTSTIANENSSHAEGSATKAFGVQAHTEGYRTQAMKQAAHAEGAATLAIGMYSHAEGHGVYSIGSHLTAEKNSTTGTVTSPLSDPIHEDQILVLDNGFYATITAISEDRLSFTIDTAFDDDYSDVSFVVYAGRASGSFSHVEGQSTVASGTGSHAEGNGTKASSSYAHAEGAFTEASGAYSHSAGSRTIANGMYMSAVGKYNIPDTPFPAWEANHQYEVGDRVVYNGVGKVCIEANNDATYRSSKWQTVYQSTQQGTLLVIGNGEENNRSNAFRVDMSGDARFAGDVYVGCNPDSTGGTKLATINDLPDAPVQDVQVNGTSVLNQNGIANIPIASDSVQGVIKTDGTFGTGMSSGGHLLLQKATDIRIRQANSDYMPIVPSNQHQAIFYGLAKAAGDITQSQSSNAVGVYTPEAKAAIQTMLGIETGTEVVRLI